MKIKILLFFALTAVFSSCADSDTSVNEIADTYYGVLPCADCPGIYYELELKEDLTFSEKMLYLESDVDTIFFSGNYKMEADSTVVLSSSTDKPRFDQMKYSNGALNVLDQNGKEITTKLSEFYVLKTTKPTGLQQKSTTMEDNTVFIGRGNEPFWTIKIDKKGDQMSFKPMEGQLLTMKLPKATEIENGLVYESTSEDGMLKITVLNEKCQDNMSGALFSHKVNISFQTSDMTSPKTYNGCGSYEGHAILVEALEGNWVLNKINKETVKNNSSYKNPTMKINVIEGEIGGNGGCNRYSGSIKSLGGNKLSISRIVSTKMTCPGQALETAYFKALTNEALSYKLEDDKLILFNKESTLVYGKMK